MSDPFLPLAREAGKMDGCQRLMMAALGASLLVGMLQHWEHMEDRKWRRKLEMEREERRMERDRSH
jgi:hypothetical protein